MYSALKHRGQPLYRLARAGIEVPREAREVTVHGLDLLGWEPPVLEFRVHCSKGTYVRTLAEDIARALDSCGHLQALRRLEVEPFEEREMIGLEALTAAVEAGQGDSLLLPVDAGLRDWPVLGLDDVQAARFRHGNPVPGLDEAVLGPARVYGPDGLLLGLGEVSAAGLLTACRVMNL
jgi:tRNA pseudouridine55 synthase